MLMTGPQIKKLSGLDNTDVPKGRDSFEKLRLISDTYSPTELSWQEMRERIDRTKIFYQTDFISYLSQTPELACSGLTCGFSGVDGINC
eukprot:scaffold528002_cov51-Attheya_sp.AAC.2